jgi:multidrug efflux pump subunit AcrA (membrane-fusion protein)
MKKLLAVVIILAVVAVGIWRISQILKARREASQKVEESPPAVEIQEVARGTIKEELSPVGNIVAASEVTVFPKVPGKVVQILVDKGNRVRKGGVMAKIEDKELRLQGAGQITGGTSTSWLCQCRSGSKASKGPS